jgi:hypothetical protein
MIHWDRESGNNDPAGDLAKRGIALLAGPGYTSPVSDSGAFAALAPVQHITSQQGQHQTRQASHPSQRPGRPTPSPISVAPHTANCHPASLGPGSAGLSHYVPPHALPPTPVSAVSTTLNKLAIASVGGNTPEGRHGSTGMRSSSFGGTASAPPLPSPSALGLALSPGGRTAPAYHGHRVSKSHSRSYSTDTDDTELTSSTLDY